MSERKEFPLMEWESDGAEHSTGTQGTQHTWSPFCSSSARVAAQTGILNVCITEVIMYDFWS